MPVAAAFACLYSIPANSPRFYLYNCVPTATVPAFASAVFNTFPFVARHGWFYIEPFRSTALAVEQLVGADQPRC